MTTENNETVNGPVLTLTEAAPKPRLEQINGVPVLILPPDWESEPQEYLLDKPGRVRATPSFYDYNAFINYVARFKNANSVVWISDHGNSLKLKAIIDYHSPANDPDWCEHTAAFQAEETPAWSHWRKANNQLMRQADFAGFIYDNQVEITDPKGSDLLEIIQTLKATSTGEFRDMKDLNTGSVDIVFRQKVSAQGGTTDKPINLPKTFQIEVVPYYGCPAIQLRADLVIRAPKEDGHPLMLGFAFYRMEDEFQALFEKIRAETAEQLDLPVYRGTP